MAKGILKRLEFDRYELTCEELRKHLLHLKNNGHWMQDIRDLGLIFHKYHLKDVGELLSNKYWMKHIGRHVQRTYILLEWNDISKTIEKQIQDSISSYIQTVLLKSRIPEPVEFHLSRWVTCQTATITGTSPITLDEMTLLDRVYKYQKTINISVTGGFGSGKCWVLDWLAYHVKKTYNHRLVLYISAREMIDAYKKVWNDKIIVEATEDKSNISMPKRLRKYLENSSSDLPIRAMRNMVWPSEAFTEIFVGCVDDIDKSMLDHLSSIFTILNAISDVRITTACSHDALCHLKRNTPFNEFRIMDLAPSETIHIFLNHWKTTKEIVITEQVRDFANQCLHAMAVDENIQKFEMAGPLITSLTAEILATDASYISLSPMTQKTHTLGSLSLFKIVQEYTREMYSHLPYSETDYFEVALQQLTVIPFKVRNHGMQLGSCTSSENFNSGFLSLTANGNIKFKHTILAQYHLAEGLFLFIKDWKCSSHAQEISYEDVFDWVFGACDLFSSTKQDNKKFIHGERNAQVICYFLNEMLLVQTSTYASQNFTNYLDRTCKKQSKFLISLIRFAVRHTFRGFLHQVYSCKWIDDKYLDSIDNNDYKYALVAAILCGNENILFRKGVDEILQLDLTHDRKFWNISLTALHLAAREGNVRIFQRLCEKTEKLPTGLIHITVDNSRHLAKDKVNGKLKILRELLRIMTLQGNLNIDEKIGPGMSPLLMDNIHCDLVLFLLRNGFNPALSCGYRQTFLHKSPRYLTPNEFGMCFYEISKTSTDLKQTLRQKDTEGKMPFQIAIECLSLTVDTIDLMAYLLEDSVSQESNYQENIVYALIKNNFKEKCLAVALRRKSGWTPIDYLYKGGKTNLLHVAAELENTNAIKYIRDVLGVDMLREDGNGKTYFNIFYEAMQKQVKVADERSCLLQRVIDEKVSFLT